MQIVNNYLPVLPDTLVDEKELNNNFTGNDEANAEPINSENSFLEMVKKLVTSASKENREKSNELSLNKNALKETKIDYSNFQNEVDIKNVKLNLTQDSTKTNKAEKNAESKISKQAQTKMLKEDKKTFNTKFSNLEIEGVETSVFFNMYEEVEPTDNNAFVFSENDKIQDVLPKEVTEDVLLFSSVSDSNLSLLDKKKVSKEDKDNVKTDNLKITKKQKENLKKGSIYQHEENVKENIAVKNNTKTKQRISVEDLRTVSNVRQDLSIHIAGSEVRVDADNSLDMQLDFTNGIQNAGQSSETSTTLQTGSETQKKVHSFSEILSQQIRESSADFVQAGKILLRDNNMGEIRLQLRPEHLGAVKFHLELSEGKRISGTVTVSTKEAYEAFEQSLDNLAEEFKQSGFETAEFNLNWQGSFSQNDASNDFDFFNSFDGKNMGQNVRSIEKTADNINTYSYAYGSTVDILI